MSSLLHNNIVVFVLIAELGKRLEEAKEANDEYSLYAEICYISSGNIGPLINKRLSGADLSITNIQVLLFFDT